MAIGGVGTILVTAIWMFLFPELRRIRSLDEAAEAQAARGRAGTETYDRSRNPGASAETGKGVQTVTVGADEEGMRLDRFFEARYPGLSFSHIQRIIRKGEVRVNGKRAEPKDRLQKGQAIRIPPLKIEPPKPRDNATSDQKDRAFLKSITLYEDDDVLVLNKPMGLAVQGGSGTFRHLDGMLGSMTGKDGQRPRLVHRLDKDTSAACWSPRPALPRPRSTKTFRTRSARKIYWALVAGVPRPKQGRVSTFLAKEDREDESIMRIARHGDEGASHAVTYYAVVETAAQKLAWLSLKPVTGRTHQLRAHMEHIGHPIIGDEKYFRIENYEFPGGMQNKLHLLARRIAVPHPRGGRDRRHRAAAAAHAADLESARLRRQALRSDRRGARGMSGALTIWARQRLADIKERLREVSRAPGSQDRRAVLTDADLMARLARRRDDLGIRGKASARCRGLQAAASRCTARCWGKFAARPGCIWSSASTRASLDQPFRRGLARRDVVRLRFPSRGCPRPGRSAPRPAPSASAAICLRSAATCA